MVTHVFKRGIEIRTPYFFAMRLKIHLLLEWAVLPTTKVFINTSFLLPSALVPLPFL